MTTRIHVLFSAVALVVVFSAPTSAGELHDAARAGDVDGVTRIIQGGAPVDGVDADGGTPLHWAAFDGHEDVVEVLLEHGASVDRATPERRTALHLAALHGHLDVVRTLLDRGANVESVDADGVPPLGLAVAGGFPDVADLLIRRGANADQQFPNGTTYLHGVAYAGHPEHHRDLVHVLIEGGAEVDAATRTEGNTPLHLAALFGNRDAVLALLEAGADPERPNAYDDRALHNAAATGQVDIVILLLDRGVHTDRPDASGMTPLHWAVAEGKKTRRGRGLLEFVTWRRGGVTPAHDFVATARALIERGASVDIRDDKGRTAAKLAKKRGDPRMVALFEEP